MHPPVLVVGHDTDRLATTRDALVRGRLANPVVACRDADDARDYVLGRGAYADRDRHPLPAVVVTDLRLASGSGLDVLRTVRGHLRLRRTPVVVVADTAAGVDDEEIREAHHLGAAAFLAEHVAPDVLLGVIRETGVPWSVGRVELGA